MLFAQVTEEVAKLGDWLGPTSAVASMGFAVWFGYRTVTKTIPEMMQNYRTDMEAARKEFKAEISAERQHCEHELSRIVDLHERSTSTICEAVRSLKP